MTRETWLILVAGGLGIVALGSFAVVGWRWMAPAKTTAYRPKHSGEFPIVPVPHVGATDSPATSQWVAHLSSVPSLLDDPWLALRAAEEQLKLAQLRVADARQRVAAAEAKGVHERLENVVKEFNDRLARTGQDLMDTHEWRRGDVERMMVAAGRPGGGPP